MDPTKDIWILKEGGGKVDGLAFQPLKEPLL